MQYRLKSDHSVVCEAVPLETNWSSPWVSVENGSRAFLMNMTEEFFLLSWEPMPEPDPVPMREDIAELKADLKGANFQVDAQAETIRRLQEEAREAAHAKEPKHYLFPTRCELGDRLEAVEAVIRRSGWPLINPVT